MQWSADEIREIREHMRMSRAEFARLLNVDARSVYRWENGESVPSGSAESVLLGVRQALSTRNDKVTKALAVIGGLAALGGLGLLINKLIEMLSAEDAGA